MYPDKNETNPEIDPNSGEFIVDWLRQTGSDIEREHEFFFYVYFPSESLARAAGERITSTGLAVTIDASPQNNEWLCLVVCPQTPDESKLNSMVAFLKALSTEYFGKFDGWESSLEM
ncbi:MAG: ribonuclease E inhibitor RraB [Verrucomicrobia bacterium]|nr:ribonuclease E inhibitor RraB [Verrucomicrobiota bacterium]